MSWGFCGFCGRGDVGWGFSLVKNVGGVGWTEADDY